jgi:hypothetical protein
MNTSSNKKNLTRCVDMNQQVTLSEGDNLLKIAQEAYGKPGLWRSIYEHNRAALGRNPAQIKGEVTITVPSLSELKARGTSRTQVLMAYEAYEEAIGELARSQRN